MIWNWKWLATSYSFCCVRNTHWHIHVCLGQLEAVAVNTSFACALLLRKVVFVNVYIRTSSILQTLPEPLGPLPSTLHSTRVCTVHSINDLIVNVVTHWSWGIRGYYHESTSMGSSSAKCSHTHSLGPHTHTSIPTLTSPIKNKKKKAQ